MMDDLRYFGMDVGGGLLRWFSEQEVGPMKIWTRFAELARQCGNSA
jgi:hypothetical protein